jgi:phosphonate transport system ATP-binding protein
MVLSEKPRLHSSPPPAVSGHRRTAVEVRDIEFSYDRRRPVLDGVNLDIVQGEITMLLGRSGNGKTTLLKVIKGLLRPQRGTVRIHLGEEHRVRKSAAVAYVPQTLGLVRSLSALDNALIGGLSRAGRVASLLKMFPRALVDEAKDTLDRLGLADKAHEPAYRLSGGQRQRVAIARALMQRPALILADEFVSQLDALTATEILDLIRAVARENNVAVLVTTHETDVVAAYADRVVILREGRVVRDAPGGSLSQTEMLELMR